MAKLDPEELNRRLARALEVGGNTYSPDDIMDACSEGRMQAWMQGDSLVVTELLTFPRAKAVNIVIAVGLLDDVMSLQPEIEAFGRAHGCKVMRMEGRKGWARVLPRHGWREDNKVIFERAL